MHRRIIPLAIVLTLVVGYAGYQWWRGHDVGGDRLTAAGILQGDQVTIAAEVSGRVTQVLVHRGDTVEPGQVLVRLDDTELRRRFRLAPSGSPEQQLLQIQLDKLVLKAPIAGVIAERAIEPGEVAVPGAPLLTVERQEVVELVMYVSERQIGQVMLGQPISLTTDSVPGRTFSGRVEFISPRAEFTPRNVQAPEDRALLVFAVRASIANPDHVLKPGMPVDAMLGVAMPSS